MKKALPLIIVFVCVAVAAGVAVPFLLNDENLVLRLDVPPPSEIPRGEKPFPETESSTLAVTLDLPLSALASLANEKVPEDISGTEYKNFHSSVQNGVVQYQILPGNIAIQNSGQSMRFNLPIQGAAKVGGDLDIRILRLPIQGQANLQGSIHGTMRPVVNNDWRIIPNLDPNLNLTSAQLSIGRLGTIDATSLIQQAANPLIRKEIENFSEGIDVKAEMQKFWDGAHLNLTLTEDPPAYISFDPQAVSVGPINYANPQSLSLTVAMDATSYVSSFEGNVSYPENLPDLQPMQSAPVTEIKLPVIASISDVNKKMISQSITKESALGASVQVTEPEFRVGSDGFIIIGMHVDADSGKFGRRMIGKIWLKAKPEFNYATQRLGFSDILFTDETIERLPRSAASMLKKKLLNVLVKEVDIDLNPYLEQGAGELQKLIARQPMPEGIQLIPGRPKLKLHSLYTVTRSVEGDPRPSPAVVAVIEATGHMTARITKF